MRRMELSRSAEPPADAPGRHLAPNMADLVAFLNAEHGTSYRLTDRLLHGNRHVAGLYNQSGARFIVKWSPGPGTWTPSARPSSSSTASAAAGTPSRATSRGGSTPAGSTSCRQRCRARP